MSFDDILKQAKAFLDKLTSGTELKDLASQLSTWFKGFRRDDITALTAAIDAKTKAILDEVGGDRSKLTPEKLDELSTLGDAKVALTGNDLKKAMDGDIGSGVLEFAERVVPLLAKVATILV